MLRLSVCAVLAVLLVLPVTVRAGPGCIAYRDFSGIPGLGDAPVAVDLHGRVLVVDTQNQRVLRSSSARSGVMHVMAGPELLVRPVDVAVGPDGAIHVADAGRFLVQRFTPNGKAERVFGGNGGDAPGEYRNITAIDIDPSGRLYVLDDGNHRVTSYNRHGMLLQSWTLPDRVTVVRGERRRPGDDVARPLGKSISYPRAGDLTVDPEGNLVILFPDEARVGRFGPGGHLLTAWGEPGSGPGRFLQPAGLATCPGSGLVYVADTGNACVQLFTGNGKYVGQWQSIDERPDACVIRMKLVGRHTGDGGTGHSDRTLDDDPVVVADDLARPARPVVDPEGRVHMMDTSCGALTSFAYPTCPARASLSLHGLGCEAVLDPMGVQGLVLVIPGTGQFAADHLVGGAVQLPDGTLPVRTWVSDMTTRTMEGLHCIVRGPDGIPDLGIEIPGAAVLAEAGVDAYGETGTYTLLGSLDDGTPFWGTGTVRGGDPDEYTQPNRRPGDDVARLAYELDAALPVTVQVFSVTGRLVETVLSEVQPAGAHEVTWDGADRPSGIYFLRVRAGDLDRTRKIVVRN
jgi:DNA-binding beta-propeller fold protein YncE